MALIDCPECGKTISDQATACPNCGYPISGHSAPDSPDQKPCPKCAESVKSDARVCRHCGHDFERAQRGGCGPAFLSLLIPGLGQFAKGEALSGVIYFLVAVALWFVYLGWTVNIVSAFHAYAGEPQRDHVSRKQDIRPVVETVPPTTVGSAPPRASREGLVAAVLVTVVPAVLLLWFGVSAYLGQRPSQAGEQSTRGAIGSVAYPQGMQRYVSGCEDGALLVDRVNLWDEPGGTVSGLVSGGTTESCLGTAVTLLRTHMVAGRRWYLVRTDNGTTGWLLATFLTSSPSNDQLGANLSGGFESTGVQPDDEQGSDEGPARQEPSPTRRDSAAALSSAFGHDSSQGAGDSVISDSIVGSAPAIVRSAPVTQSEARIVGHRVTKRWYTMETSCWRRRIPEASRVFFRSLEEARFEGYMVRGLGCSN